MLNINQSKTLDVKANHNIISSQYSAVRTLVLLFSMREIAR